MASVEKDGQGYRVRFIDHNKERKAIRLTGINKANAQTVAHHVQQLVNWKKSGLTLDSQTADWIAKKVGQELYDKLSNAGLIEARVSSSLGDFVASYIKRRSDVKPGTTTNYDQVRLNLVAFFGYDKPLRSITANDAAAFREWLQAEEGQAENTLRRRCGRARQFFTSAMKAKLIDENPFDGMPVTVRGNKGKERFITEEESQKILDACPNAEWRLIFSLCRYGGLRCPSEVLALTWEDIIWDSSRIVVTSPKTAHHKGHESRVIPLFPELLKPLMEVQEQAAERTVHVVTRYRSSNQNLRTELNRIVRRAGIIPWQKPFQNLRSTRETELMETYPAHVVCRWIGNSEAVAKKHYLQVTDAHFEKAVIPKTAGGEGHSQGHTPCELAETGEPLKTQNPENVNVFRGSADGFVSLRDQKLTRPGLEPGKTEPKSVVLPITPPGYGRHSAETRSTELRASGILVTESQGGKVRFDGTMAVTAVPS
jgi:integrase